MIRNLGKSLGNAVLENVGWAAGRVQENAPLPADVFESDGEYLVVVDAPGATTSDVQVRYVDDVIEVRVDRFRAFHDGYEMRYPGRGLALDGRVSLPGDADVDPDAAVATLRDDGTLAVRVPKVSTDEVTDEDASDDVSNDGGAEEEVTGDDVTDSEADDVADSEADDEKASADK